MKDMLKAYSDLMSTPLHRAARAKLNSKKYADLLVSYMALVDPLTSGLEGDQTEYEPRADIINDIWDNDKASFIDSLQNALKNEMSSTFLSAYTLDDIQDYETYRVQEQVAGFALKPVPGYGKIIVSVHNNSGIPGLGKLLVQKAIEYGGNYLDCFEGKLPDKIYRPFGFEEFEVVDFDPQYDPDGSFRERLMKFGSPTGRVLYMKLPSAEIPPPDIFEAYFQ